MGTRERILEETLAIASEKGLGNVSLSQIAERVGIKKATLYSHYRSKEEIITSLYQYLRKKAVQAVSGGITDYGKLVQGKTVHEVLYGTAYNYFKMNVQGDMSAFYRFILSERCIRSEAAQIMKTETEKMITATKQLFYAMKVHGLIQIEEVDTAAYTFAMAIHSVMDYCMDQELCGEENPYQALDDFTGQYARVLQNEENR